MKNIILILISLITINIHAQAIINDGGITDPEGNKFSGTWHWKKGNDSFTLILKKETLQFGDKKHETMTGFHKLVINGKVIEDFTPYANIPFSFNEYKGSIFGSSRAKYVMGGYLEHSSKNKSIKFEIEYLNSKQIKIIKLENDRPEGLRFITKEALKNLKPYDTKILIPLNIILTKQ